MICYVFFVSYWLFFVSYAPFSPEVQQELKAKGYQLVTQSWDLGDIQAIQVVDGKVTAAADPRSRGVAQVFNLQ